MALARKGALGLAHALSLAHTYFTLFVLLATNQSHTLGDLACAHSLTSNSESIGFLVLSQLALFCPSAASFTALHASACAYGHLILHLPFAHLLPAHVALVAHNPHCSTDPLSIALCAGAHFSGAILALLGLAGLWSCGCNRLRSSWLTCSWFTSSWWGYGWRAFAQLHHSASLLVAASCMDDAMCAFFEALTHTSWFRASRLELYAFSVLVLSFTNLCRGVAHGNGGAFVRRNVSQALGAANSCGSICSLALELALELQRTASLCKPSVSLSENVALVETTSCSASVVVGDQSTFSILGALVTRGLTRCDNATQRAENEE